MSKLLDIIDRLLIMLAKWSIKREQIKAQKARDELLKNPADWFSGHFDGMPNPTDTEKANKTNTANTKAD